MTGYRCILKAENTDGGAVVDPEAGGLGLATGNHANHAMYVLCNIHYRLRVGLSSEHFYSLNLALTASQPTVALSQITHHYSCFLVPTLLVSLRATTAKHTRVLLFLLNSPSPLSDWCLTYFSNVEVLPSAARIMLLPSLPVDLTARKLLQPLAGRPVTLSERGLNDTCQNCTVIRRKCIHVYRACSKFPYVL